MHFLELLEQVSDRDTAIYYAKSCGSIPKKNYTASKTLIDGIYSFEWAATAQRHEFWSKIHKKLSTHPQNEKVTYEPEVYEQYKNEVFEDVKVDTQNIRDYSVIIKDTSIEDRRKLHSLLNCLGEPVYGGTNFHIKGEIDYNFLIFGIRDEWVMAKKAK